MVGFIEQKIERCIKMIYINFYKNLFKLDNNLNWIYHLIYLYMGIGYLKSINCLKFFLYNNKLYLKILLYLKI